MYKNDVIDENISIKKYSNLSWKINLSWKTQQTNIWCWSLNNLQMELLPSFKTIVRSANLY